MVRAQRRRYLPADTSQHEVLWEMGSLEAHGHESSPSLGTLDHRGRSYLKWPQMNFATEPPAFRGIPNGYEINQVTHIVLEMGETLWGCTREVPTLKWRSNFLYIITNVAAAVDLGGHDESI